jgi:outer membrane murein-binding lipoprotein Lpp
MASAVLEMCDLLKIYSESMNSEMERLNESASHNLNLQEMYAKTVENVTDLAVGNIYYNLKKQEKEAINELMQYVQANSDQMEKDITACAGKVKSATEAAEKASIQISKSVKRFCTVRTIGDLLYYAAPVAVVIDVLLRLFDFI